MQPFFFSKMLNYIMNQSDGAKVFSQIGTEFYKCSALSVIKRLCKEMLFTYESRLKLTISTFDIAYKVPMYINSENLFIPTSRTRDDECIWINFHAIRDIKDQEGQVVIVFVNGDRIVIDVTKTIFERQIKIAQEIDTYMKNRM